MNTHNPLISICIPAYNAAPFIENNIQNWQNQSYSNFEIIILDDYSKDDTYNIALELSKKDKRIKVFQNQLNLGIGKNWNATYEKAEGELICIFNADDLIYPFFLEEAIAIFKQQSVDLVTFKFEHYDIVNKIHWLHQPQNNLKRGLVNDVFKKVFLNMPFHWDFTVVKKKILEEVKTSNNALFMETQICDAELWYRIALNKAKIYYVPVIAGQYIKHPINNSKIAFSEDKSFVLDVLPKYHNILKKEFNSVYLKFLHLRIIHLCKKSIKSFDLTGIKLSFKILTLILKT